MVELFPADQCVACFHGGHPDGPCSEIEDGPRVTWGSICGCREYVTEEMRGKRIVHVEENVDRL